MKKLGLLVMPIMTLSFLVSCDKGLGDPKPLEECDWNKINEVSKAGKASEWFKVGDTKTIEVNGQPHQVRIIGFDHDDLADGSSKAGITFEFANLISDKDGYSLATPWFWENGYGSNNYDFLNSNLRKALDGDGNASLTWYEKGSATKSTITTSVLEMLPDNLKPVLKKVKKPIDLYDIHEEDYVVDNESYVTQLFSLSCCEMNVFRIESDDEEGKTYQYYEDADTVGWKKYVKHQVKWHDGATEKVLITDAPDVRITDPYNYAGNNGEDAENGGTYWLRSPNAFKYNNMTGYNIFVNGAPGTDLIYSYAYSVAPAFCI